MSYQLQQQTSQACKWNKNRCKHKKREKTALQFVLIKLIKRFNRNQFVEHVLERYSLFNEIYH